MADDEDRFVLGIAFKAGRYPQLRKGADGRKDIVSAEVIEKAAWGYLSEMGGQQVGIEHMDGTVGHAKVVESYIYRNDEPWLIKSVTGQDVVVNKGDWLVGMQLDEATWKLRKAGRLNGLSPQGRVARRPVARSA